MGQYPAQIALLLATLVLFGFSSCSEIGYYRQCVDGHLDLLKKRRPIEEVLNDPKATEETRKKLAAVLEIRDFASRELKLPENGSYRCFADLERPFVVWNVTATAEFSITPKNWCFPVAGCVSYRGYYSRDEAEAFADALRAEGLDVYLYGVAAYSTLGWFDDPVLNTFLGRSELGLAALIFHELAHQRLYVKGDTALNESFAMLVEEEGVQRWVLSRGQQAQEESWRLGRERHEAFVDLLIRTRGRLEALFASGLSAPEMRAGKEQIFIDLERDYAELKAGWGGDGRFDSWFDTPANNAKLASVHTYRAWVPAFRTLLRDVGGDWETFYRRAEELGRLKAPERSARLQALAERASDSL